MGLDARTVLLAWLFEIAPRAFLKGFPFLAMWVAVEDFLTRAPRMHTKNGKDQFTGDGLFDGFIKPAIGFFESGCRAYIVCCDDQTRVPLRKAAEQARRDQQAEERKAKPKNRKKRLNASDCDKVESKAAATKKLQKPGQTFHPGSRLCDAGLVEPHKSGGPKPFNLFALTRQRGLRSMLMAYLCDRAAAMVFASGRRIIIDYESRGPIEFTGQTSSWPRIRVLEDYRHPFGEADLSCVFWIAVYGRTHDVVYSSVDSDAIPICVHAVYELGLHLIPGRRVIWRDGLNTTLDICEVVRALVQLGIYPVFFALVCAMSGCDWVESGPLWNRPPGGMHSRIYKGLAYKDPLTQQRLFGADDALFWRSCLPVAAHEECNWLKDISSAQTRLAVDVCTSLLGGRSLALLVLDYLAYDQWDGDSETDFERRVGRLCAHVMGKSSLNGNKEAWREQMLSAAWTTQYWCVPWLRVQLLEPPGG